MILPGRCYDIEVPTFARQVAADEVVLRVSAPSTASLLVSAMWFGIVGTDDLNETNAMEIVRLSSDGAGGGSPTAEQRSSGDSAFGGTMASLDANDWTTDPTVSDTLGGARPFNLATGWRWSWAEEGAPITVSPSGRIGFRVVDTLSASMNIYAGMTVYEVGT